MGAVLARSLDGLANRWVEVGSVSRNERSVDVDGLVTVVAMDDAV